MPAARKTKQLDKVIKISLGQTAYSNELKPKTLSIGKFFDALRTPKKRGKKDGPYFVFASFKQNERNAQNVKHYYGAAIDIDDSSISLDVIRSTLSSYTYCLYTTYSHTLEGKGDRYRIVIPYRFPIAPNDHVDIVLYLIDKLGFDSIDLSSKTLSLPMYLPAVNNQNEDKFHYEVHKRALLNPASEMIRDAVPEIKFKHFNDDHASHTPIDINANIESGERNSSLARIVGKFLNQGSSRADVMSMAKTFNETKIIPPLDDKEVSIIVNSVIKAHSRNHGDLAWGFDEILSRLSSKAQAKDEYKHICRILAYGKLHNKFSPSELEILVNELKKQTGLTKATVNSEITSASLEIQGKDEELNEDTVKEESETIRQKFKNWVYIAQDDRIYNIYTGEYFKREAFNAMFHMPELKNAMFNILIKYNLINKVSRLEFDPEEKPIYTRNKIKHGNTYIAPDVEPVKGDVSPLIEHFEYLFPSDYERGIVLDFIGFLIQFPGRKIRWMPIIKGHKGIGKSIIAEQILLPMIGISNLGKVDNVLLKSDFNAWQLNKQLIVFEELNVGDSQKEKRIFTERLKSFITDNLSKAHRKGMDPYDVINKACCLAFTNFDDPVIITMDERRFCMLRTDASPKPDKYYSHFIKWCNSHAAEMFYYFQHRDVSEFRYMAAPHTDFTEEVKTISMPWPSSILYDLKKGKFPKYTGLGCLTLNQIIQIIKANSAGKYLQYAEDFMSTGSGSYKALNISLSDLSFKKYTRPGKQDDRVCINGKKETVWMLPARELDVLAINPRHIGRLLSKIRVKDSRESETWT